MVATLTLIGFLWTAHKTSAVTHLVNYEYTPVAYDTADHVVTIDFTMKFAALQCSTATAEVTVGPGVENLGSKTWTAKVEFPETEQRYYIEEELRPTRTERLRFRIPANDTSFVETRLGCRDWILVCPCYFVTTQDTIEYWPDVPMKPYHPPAKGERKPRRKLPGDTVRAPKTWVIPPEDTSKPAPRPDSEDKLYPVDLGFKAYNQNIGW